METLRTMGRAGHSCRPDVHLPSLGHPASSAKASVLRDRTTEEAHPQASICCPICLKHSDKCLKQGLEGFRECDYCQQGPGQGQR